MYNQKAVESTEIPSTTEVSQSVPSKPSQGDRRSRGTFVAGIAMGVGLAASGGVGYFLGQNSSIYNIYEADLLQASASHGGENMAVATGQIGDDSEGFFALDFLTGNLQGQVLNPRRGGVAATYAFNVQDVLGGASKNPQYLLVTGTARLATSSQSSIIYVVNTNTGMYAALGVPWDRTLESSGATQGGLLTLLTTGQLREPIGLGRRTVTPPVIDKKPVAPAVKPAAPKPGVKPAGEEEKDGDLFGVGPGNPNAPGNPRKQR